MKIYTYLTLIASACLSFNSFAAPDQFKTTDLSFFEQKGWLSLSKSNGQWRLSKLNLRDDPLSGGFEPSEKPIGTILFFRVKELKAGIIQVPQISLLSHEISNEYPDISLTKEILNGSGSQEFSPGPTVLKLLGNKYRFVIRDIDKISYLYLLDKEGLVQIGKMDCCGGPSIRWAGDLNRDGRLDLILAGDGGSSLFLSTAKNCYRLIPEVEYEDHELDEMGNWKLRNKRSINTTACKLRSQ